MALPRKSLALLALLPLLFACSGEEASAKAAVEGFYSESWEEGETARDYLASVEPYLTEEALASAEEAFGEEFDERTSIRYSEVEVREVTVEEATAEAVVSYTVTYSFEGVEESEEKTESKKLVKEEGTWQLTE